jgi:hypothetical protein
MPAKKGNNYWQNRKKHGREKIIKTPEELWGLACDYFKWCDDNPIISYEPIRTGKEAGKLLNFPLGKPYTWEGFDDYLFSQNVIASIENYKDNKDNRYKDFVGIVTRIRNVIYSQKFEGAAVGVFNANIIARDLGLVDKTENKNKNTHTVDPEVVKNLKEHLKSLEPKEK